MACSSIARSPEEDKIALRKWRQCVSVKIRCSDFERMRKRTKSRCRKKTRTKTNFREKKWRICSPRTSIHRTELNVRNIYERTRSFMLCVPVPQSRVFRVQWQQPTAGTAGENAVWAIKSVTVTVRSAETFHMTSSDTTNVSDAIRQTRKASPRRICQRAALILKHTFGFVRRSILNVSMRKVTIILAAVRFRNAENKSEGNISNAMIWWRAWIFPLAGTPSVRVWSNTHSAHQLAFTPLLRTE